LLVASRGEIPPTINNDDPDPDCDLDCVPNVKRTQAVRVALSNSFGFGGHNATLAVRAM
jgi:3-oxoacyl-[acyl-carrier-protein] synthase II